MNIGERQTVQQAKHPTLGEGRAIYGNGPTFFLADSGETLPLRDVLGPGWSKGPPERTWLVAHLPSGERINLDTTGRKRGKTHERIITQNDRGGWLVSWSDSESRKGRFHWYRFEPDSGEPITLRVSAWWMGQAGDEKSRKRAADLAPWRSIYGDGVTFTFRLDAEIDAWRRSA